MIVGLHTLGDTSAFVNPVGQLRRGKTRMEGVGIVFKFYSPSLIPLCWIVDAFARLHDICNNFRVVPSGQSSAMVLRAQE